MLFEYVYVYLFLIKSIILLYVLKHKCLVIYLRYVYDSCHVYTLD